MSSLSCHWTGGPPISIMSFKHACYVIYMGALHNHAEKETSATDVTKASSGTGHLPVQPLVTASNTN